MDDAQRDTVLAALRDTGFVTYGYEHIGPANTALIVTGGGLDQDAETRVPPSPVSPRVWRRTAQAP